MSRLLESIRCENGELQNVPLHQARMDASVKSLFSSENRTRLEDVVVPGNCHDGLYKCRLTYTTKLETIEFLPYELPRVRSIKIVTDDDIDYSLKYTNRGALQQLLKSKGDCDEILIVKNGLLTDTSYSNILFLDGEQWLTPALPLLRGTQREKLLAEEKIVPTHIRPVELSRFEKIRMINAMIRFEDQCDIESISD
jgi:4-amino-4-deoxychorismate lyase